MAGPHLPSPKEAEPLEHRKEQDEELLSGLVHNSTCLAHPGCFWQCKQAL